MTTGESVGLAVAFVGAGALLVTLGYLIGRRRAMWLVAGYDPDRVADEAGLARFLGAGATVLGVAHIALGVAALTRPIPGTVWLGLAVVMPLAALVLFVGARRYRVPTAATEEK